MKARKSLGQNFLMEIETAQKMVAALELDKDDLVVEIGPGLGAVTKLLVQNATQKKASIKAIEIDTRFFQKLQNIFGNNQNFELINDDILKWLPNFYPEKEFKILGSIPYYITSPILHEVVRQKGKVRKAVFLVQKEVAQKINKLSPDGSYLSNFINTFFETEIIRNVPREFFKPIPKVDSAVLQLTRKENIEIPYEDICKYEKFLHHAFSKPRKMLNKVFSDDFLGELDISSKHRPQHLTLDTWIKAYLLWKQA